MIKHSESRHRTLVERVPDAFCVAFRRKDVKETASERNPRPARFQRVFRRARES